MVLYYGDRWLSHSFRVHQIRFWYPAGEAYSTPQAPSWFKGDLLLRERGRVGEKRREERGGEGERRRRGKGRGWPPNANSWIRPCVNIYVVSTEQTETQGTQTGEHQRRDVETSAAKACWDASST